MTVSERAAAGKAARSRAPRSSHGEWEPSAGREIYARLCAWTMARAHARSEDAVAIGAYLGSGDSLDLALAEFSRLYADQNERDYAAMRKAIDSGRLPVEDA